MTLHETPLATLGILALFDDAARRRRLGRVREAMLRYGIHRTFAEFVVDDPGPAAPAEEREAYEALMSTLAEMSRWPAEQRDSVSAELRRAVWGER